jgi:hypothetical protein
MSALSPIRDAAVWGSPARSVVRALLLGVAACGWFASPLAAQTSTPYQITNVVDATILPNTAGVTAAYTVPLGPAATLTLSGTLPTAQQQAASPVGVCFSPVLPTAQPPSPVAPSLPIDSAGDETVTIPASVVDVFSVSGNGGVVGSAYVYFAARGATCNTATQTQSALSNVVLVYVAVPDPNTYTGSANVPQTNSATGVQAAPAQIVVTGSYFSSNTVGSLQDSLGNSTTITPTHLRSDEATFVLPSSFSSEAVGTTAILRLCNTGGTTPVCPYATPVTLTITGIAPSVGSLRVTPTPVTTAGTTTLTAQFKRDPTNTMLPPAGVPSGVVNFTSNGNPLGSAALTLDSSATFVSTTTTAAIPTAATPVISPAAGTYAAGQTVTISDTNPFLNTIDIGQTIYYTLDGTTPNTSSPVYTTPLTVSATTTVTAIATASGYLTSKAASSTFTIFTPIPTSLAFLQQPTTTPYSQPITPAVTVEILDQNGNLITNSTLAVSMSLSSNPGETRLAGTTTVNAVNGIATFSNLSLPVVANGYALVATSSGLVQAVSTSFNITPPPITVSLFAPLVGVTSTLPGTFTLGQPAPPGGVAVSLASSATGNVTVSPATVTVPAGQTSGSFTYTGVGPGAANITASATGYLTGSATVNATYSLVSLGTIPPVAPGQSVSLALSIATAAPAGGVTVNFSSSNPGVATVTSSVFIPAGQRTAATNPQIVGVIIGTTTITATAQGYAPDTRSVNVTVTASFSPSSVTIAHQTYSNITLNISAPATTGGLTFTLSSDATATATVPASVTIPAGQTSVIVPVTGVADGNTTVRADSPGVTEATLSVYVSTQLGLYYGSSITGFDMQVANYAYVPTAPAMPTTVTVTISDPTIATVSTSQTVAGTGTVTYTNITSASNSVLYFQGQKTGTATVTISAPGYTTGTNTVTVYPSGFYTSSGSFSTTTFSSPTGITVQAGILNPTSLTVYSSGTLNPGVGPINVPVISGTPATGTITTSPVVFTGDQNTQTTTFQPAAAGTSTISIGTPTGVAGFSTPSNSTSLTATVTAPQLSFYYGNTITGVNMMGSNYVYVPVAPPTATTYTVTSSNPAVATISTSGTTVGTASLTLANQTGSGNIQQIFIQGQSVGTTTLTVSGNGYTSGTITVTVYPSGFNFGGNYYGGLSTTTFSSASTVYVYPVILNPTSLTEYSTGTLNPGIGPFSVPVTSSNTATGTITTSPVVFMAGGTSMTTTFQPSGAGTTTISVGAPTGTGAAAFSTPANYTSFTATVTAPQAGIYYGSQITGVDMMVGNATYLPVAPPSAVTITVTSSNPAVATLSTSQTTAGTATVTYPGVTSAGTMQLYVQGQSAGTTTLTISAPGYSSGTATITVYPSGFGFAGNGGFSTTTFSSPSNVYVYPELLSPGSLNYYNTGTLNPGVGPFSVAVTSSNTTVGNITTSPAVFMAGSSSVTTSFQPTSAGTSTVAVGGPTGTGSTVFSTPANSTSFTATVTAPALGFYYSTVTTGVDIQSVQNVYLPVAPPNPVTVTVTSNGPAIATLSTSATTVGTTTVTFTNVTSAGYLGNIYVQGQATGSTTITASAPGYTNAVSTVTVDPSGFTFGGNYSGGLTLNSAASPFSIPVYPSILNPGTLTYNTYGYFSPGLGGTSVPITSSNTGTATIGTSPLVFNGGEQSIYTTVKPVADGTSNITITQPSGFSTPSNYVTIPLTIQN